MFSKSCEYGIKAVIYILTQSKVGRRIKVAEIAENSDSPVAFVAKILGTLVRQKIVSSQTGPNGGFYIASNRLFDLKLSDIVYAIDGDAVYQGCGLGLKNCDALNPCPLHEKFVNVRNDLKAMLETTTIHDLAEKIKKGESVLIR